MFSRFLVLNGFIDLTPKWLKRKIAREELRMIHYGLQMGRYDTRELAAKHLGRIKSVESTENLINAIDDPVPAVSEAAMCALEIIGISPDIERRIQEKRAYWKKRELNKGTSNHSSEKKYIPERKDRPSRKSYENLKQMLRKPMNSGKWF